MLSKEGTQSYFYFEEPSWSVTDGLDRSRDVALCQPLTKTSQVAVTFPPIKKDIMQVLSPNNV